MKRSMALGPLVTGAGLITAAMLEKQTGSNHGLDWEPGRILLISGGLLVVALAAWAQVRDWVQDAEPVPLIGGLREHRIVRWIWARRLGIAAACMVVVALVIYAFFASAGTWRTWPETSRYYDDLGAAFRAGRLDLNIQPPAQLMALPDPYEPSARNKMPDVRAFVRTVWDLTFYKGKFYAYWGPAPALILAAVKLFYGGPIADQHLTFIFLSGLLIFSTVLILRLRRGFYQDVPAALVLTAVAAMALAYPIPWMLSHAAIYEASIAAAQFFLIGGLYFAFRGLAKGMPSRLDLLLASIFWSLAVGSRLLMIFPVACLAGTTFLWAMGKNRVQTGVRGTARYLAILGLPLLATGLGLSYYNWVRFGSFFETGVRYMLTSENLSRFYSETFRALYARPNIRLYLGSPIRRLPKFPFLAPNIRPASSWQAGSNMGIYHVEQMTGLVYALPFAWFSAVAVADLRRWASKMLMKTQQSAHSQYGSAVSWLSISLSGSILLSFAALVMYFYVAIRFLDDVVPSLLLLAVLGMWQGYRALGDRPTARSLYTFGAIALGLLSIGISLLLTMGESSLLFQHYNPHLMAQLQHLFAH